MSDSNIDRRTILSATLAWAAATLSGCSDKASGGTCVGATGADGGVGGYSCGITMTGDHMHPLTICGADVQTPPTDNPTMTKTYTLPDGGTGHIHMVTLNVYDFLYLAAGTTVVRDSTTTNAHLHTCTITCTAL
jgi:hypothetical protein